MTFKTCNDVSHISQAFFHYIEVQAFYVQYLVIRSRHESSKFLKSG